MIMRKDMVVTEEERYRCPFYKFSWISTIQIFLENPRSNGCGLKMLTMNAHSPCEMENREEGPHWAGCELNCEENQPLLEELVSGSSVYFASGRSLPFREWYKEATGEDFDK